MRTRKQSIERRRKKRARNRMVVGGLAAMLSVLPAMIAVSVLVKLVGALQVEMATAREVQLATVAEYPVAVRDLGVGTLLTAEHVEVRPLSAAHVPDAALDDLDSVLGRVVLSRILADELIRPERLAEVGAGDGLEALLADGMRALALDLRDDDQVSGFVEPGASVDIVVTLPAGDQRLAETVTVLEAVRVLAVDEQISVDRSGDSVRSPRITVMLTPDRVERATHALSEGQAKLTLRSDIDIHRQTHHGVVSADLLGTPAQRMTPAEFHEAFDADAVWAMVDLVAGANVERERVPIELPPDALILEGFDDPR